MSLREITWHQMKVSHTLIHQLPQSFKISKQNNLGLYFFPQVTHRPGWRKGELPLLSYWWFFILQSTHYISGEEDILFCPWHVPVHDGSESQCSLFPSKIHTLIHLPDSYGGNKINSNGM